MLMTGPPRGPDKSNVSLPERLACGLDFLLGNSESFFEHIKLLKNCNKTFTVNRMIILILIEKIHSLNEFVFILIPFFGWCQVYLWVVQAWERNVQFPPNSGPQNPSFHAAFP